MSAPHGTNPPPLTWDPELRTGRLTAKLDSHGTAASLVRTAGGWWWQVYWPGRKWPDGTIRVPRAARQGNEADRDAAERAAFAAYHEGRP